MSIKGKLMVGIVVEGNSVVIADGANISGNHGGGVKVQSGSHASLDNANISNNIGDGVHVSDSTVNANGAIILNNGIQTVYNELSIDPEVFDSEKLEALIIKAIEEKSNNNPLSKIMDWANNAAIFATIAGSEPLIAAISAIASCSIEVLQRYLNIIKS